MKRVAPTLWKPVAVENLEPTALDAVRSDFNSLVVAGPGAGKTELLAQRACFLLQTGTCPHPRRILAMSFKKDAANEIRQRVRRRCPLDAVRFDSFTFDSFAKGLVDRFLGTLPAAYRPPPDYEVRLAKPTDREVRAFFTQLNVVPENIKWLQRHVDPGSFYRDHVIATPLTLPNKEPEELVEWAADQWWARATNRARSKDEPAALTFPMLCRLAEAVLRANPRILKALRATYAYVFLDEFQDTAPVQFSLITTAFGATATVLTAVGDGKQRIMGWAGADPAIFERYTKGFSAHRLELVRNYRSAPELVRILNLLAQQIEHGAAASTSFAKLAAAGICEIWEFEDADHEAQVLADEIVRGLSSEGYQPEDYALLSRMWSEHISRPLVDELARRDVNARDESKLQDILAEPAAQLILDVLRLASATRDAPAWSSLVGELDGLHGSRELNDAHGPAEMATSLVRECRDRLNSVDSAAALYALCRHVIDLAGPGQLRHRYQQYTNRWLSKTTQAIANAAWDYYELAGEWPRALALLCGADTVRAMTIHKSKGLEFRTVFFLGLEDSSWWGFPKAKGEERRSFFVAFSRAKERVIFTFSKRRNHRGKGVRTQLRQDISPLYEALTAAGVEVRTFSRGE